MRFGTSFEKNLIESVICKGRLKDWRSGKPFDPTLVTPEISIHQEQNNEEPSTHRLYRNPSSHNVSFGSCQARDYFNNQGWNDLNDKNWDYFNNPYRNYLNNGSWYYLDYSHRSYFDDQCKIGGQLRAILVYRAPLNRFWLVSCQLERSVKMNFDLVKDPSNCTSRGSKSPSIRDLGNQHAAERFVMKADLAPTEARVASFEAVNTLDGFIFPTE